MSFIRNESEPVQEKTSEAFRTNYDHAMIGKYRFWSMLRRMSKEIKQTRKIRKASDTEWCKSHDKKENWISLLRLE